MTDTGGMREGLFAGKGGGDIDGAVPVKSSSTRGESASAESLKEGRAVGGKAAKEIRRR